MPQRRFPPPSGFITATRAKQLLGNISDGLLRSYVMKGEIEKRIPDTRSQGFYKDEDVRALAHRLNIDRSIHFSRGTVDDLPECDELLIKVFGKGNPDDTGRVVPNNPIERRATWIQKNPDTFFILRAGRSLVGCVFMLPLTRSKIQQILENEITRPIYAEDVQVFTPGMPIHLYVMSACVYAEDRQVMTKRFYGSRLLNGLLKRITELGGQGINLEMIWSRSETKDGIGLLRHVGFTEIETQTSSRNFLIDVKLSGIPDVVRYKHALAEYQQSHQEALQPSIPSVPPTHTPQREKAISQPHMRIQDTLQPPGTITLQEFAEQLGIARRTLLEQVVKYDLAHTQIPNPARPGETKRYFTAEQQEAVREFRTARKQ